MRSALSAKLFVSHIWVFWSRKILTWFYPFLYLKKDGFTGVNCTSFTPTHTWWVATGIVHIALSSLGIFLSCYMISQMFIWNLISYRNSFSMAIGQNFFGFLFLLLAELILVVSLHYPNQDFTHVSSPTSSKDMNDVILRDIFLIFSIISTKLLVWIEFA